MTAMSEAALQQEHHNLATVFQELHYQLPDTMPPIAFAKALAGPFAPDQLPTIDTLHNLTPEKRNHLKFVQLELSDRINQGDPDVLRLGHAAGRCLGALIDNHIFTPDVSVQIEPDSITVDGQSVAFARQSGQSIELGMGIAGLATHLNDLRANPKHTLGGVVKNGAEVVLLEGAAEYHGVESQVVVDTSLVDSVESMSRNYRYRHADIVISSNAHHAGEHLNRSMRMAPGLLRQGGVIIARGPATWNEQGTESGYEHVGHILGQDDTLQIEYSGRIEPAPSHGSHSDYLTIARRM